MVEIAGLERVGKGDSKQAVMMSERTNDELGFWYVERENGKKETRRQHPPPPAAMVRDGFG